MLYELAHLDRDQILGVYESEQAVHDAMFEYIEEEDCEDEVFSITLYETELQ